MEIIYGNPISIHECIPSTGITLLYITRDVPDPDTGIRYPVKFRHPALSGIRYKFAGYLPDSTVRYFVTTMKRKGLLGV
jgi:hypothetical protein